MSRHRILLVIASCFVLSFSLGLSACNSEQPPVAAAAPAPPPAQQQASAPAAQAAAPATLGQKVDQEITMTTDGDNLYWASKTLAVKAGSIVKLTLKNTSSASGGMAHNWVLAKTGTEQAVATDSMQVGEDKNWVAEGPNVITHTTLIKPGAETSITFTAPPAGVYPYFCSYPGHATTMNGKLTSK
jgi:azurin